MSKKETIEWLRDKVMSNEEDYPLKCLNNQLTMAIVYCIYRALSDTGRPNYGNDFS